MPTQLEDRFTNQVKHFFKMRRLKIINTVEERLISFLYVEFEKQNRFKKDDDTPFYITARFVFDAINKFSTDKHLDFTKIFDPSKPDRELRRPATVKRPSFREIKTSRGRGLIERLGQKKKPEFKITKPSGAPLTPKRMKHTKGRTTSFQVTFSPIVPLPSVDARQKGISEKGVIYVNELVTPELSLWRERTPSKPLFSPDRIRVARPPMREPLELTPTKLRATYDVDAKKGTSELFEFRVTKEDIINRVNVRRPIDQKRVMDGHSAINILRAVGVVLSEKQSGRNFHWAHRQGWSLHGDQVKENLDPMTAGSNYDTLFKVEAPLKRLLMDEKLDEIIVNGEVTFHEETGLPHKIKYRLSWGTPGFIEVMIDPMSHRIPTVEEHNLVRTLFEMETSSLRL